MEELPNCEIFNILDFVGDSERDPGKSSLDSYPGEDLLSLIASVISEDDADNNSTAAAASQESSSTTTIGRHAHTSGEDSNSSEPQSETDGTAPAALSSPDIAGALISLPDFFDQQSPLQWVDESATILQEPNICPVCHSSKQGKHLYYGGPVCVSCRGFFKRSVESNNFKLFECVQSTSNCGVNSKARKSCKWCRFERCLSSGMKPIYVMSAEERQKRLLKQMRCQKKSNGHLMRRNFRLSFKFTADEEFELRNVAKIIIDYSCDVYFKYFARNSADLKTFLQCGTGLVTDTGNLLGNMDKEDERALKTFFFDHFEMKELCPYDRMTLIQENYKKLRAVFWLACFQENSMKEFRDDLWKYADKNLQDPVVALVMQQRDLIAPETVNNSLPGESIENWAPHALEVPGYKDHVIALRRIVTWFYDGSDGVINQAKLILLIFICLYSTEGLNLEEGKKIADLQNKYVWKLHRMLFSKNEKSAAKKLHEGLMLISFAENAHHHFVDKLIYV